MSVGSLFAVFCLLSGRTGTMSSSNVFLFLCLGLYLSVVFLRLGSSAGEGNAIDQDIVEIVRHTINGGTDVRL